MEACFQKHLSLGKAIDSPRVCSGLLV